MVPIKFQTTEFLEGVTPKKFKSDILSMCENHKNQGRALAYAFLMYDFENPQIAEVLENKNYWNALHKISGKYLSVFYLNSREEHFAEDLNNQSGVVKRELCGIDSFEGLSSMIAPYFDLEDKVKLPSILFFQTRGRMITDYFVIELNEEKIEDSFLELKSYIKVAVENLKGVKPENYKNSESIFDLLKRGVEGEKIRKVFFKNIKTFPVQLVINWFVGKCF
ncbi:hypothetical protein [Marinifilum flexuosum]|uniref:hypothetical protein n=1 Tax=Marinifilum flexuosum TaxID=1117708 RepID=UPI002494A5F7|nr:hypothetical protein [Marinifilum flexuosum]